MSQTQVLSDHSPRIPEMKRKFGGRRIRPALWAGTVAVYWLAGAGAYFTGFLRERGMTLAGAESFSLFAAIVTFLPPLLLLAAAFAWGRERTKNGGEVRAEFSPTQAGAAASSDGHETELALIDSPLFRPEVLAERETQSLGTVLLTPSVPLKSSALFAVLAAAGLICLMVFGEYTTTARINGWLVPQQGLLRVVAPQSGVVMRVHVQEGTEVRKGQPLIELSSELQSGAGAVRGTQEEVGRQLTLRRQSLLDNRAAQERLFNQHGRDLSDRIVTLQSTRDSLTSEIALQTERSALAADFSNKQQELLRRGFITNQVVQDAEQNRLAQAAQLLTLERERETIERERATVEAELRDLPLTKKAKLAEIEREIAALDQESALTEARRGIVITAPQDGTVATLQAEVGGRAETTAPLLSIIPAGSKLEAHLFSPSRDIGFVRKGQRVLLRYQAFPYQKFGQYEGVVADVSRSALNPGDLGQQLPGLSALYGANEPVYRITVALKAQGVTAYGAMLPLQPGMQLEASVVMETRTLLEWMFDPLFTLTGALP
jgi:membrane fusion protein